MNGHDGDRIAAGLAAALAAGASAARMAAAITVLAEGVERTLTPVLGPRGVAALFKRAVHLAARVHPWLIDMPATIDARALGAALAKQPSDDAAAAGLLCLTTLDSLLIGLIGGSLTDRLLHPVWAGFPSDTPLQDIPP